MQAFRTLLSDSDMMAYLAMMAPRLVELRRVLKPSGKMQLLTVEDLLTGKTIDRPPIQTSTTFKRAPKAATTLPERNRLVFDDSDSDQPF